MHIIQPSQQQQLLLLSSQQLLPSSNSRNGKDYYYSINNNNNNNNYNYNHHGRHSWTTLYGSHKPAQSMAKARINERWYRGMQLSEQEQMEDQCLQIAAKLITNRLQQQQQQPQKQLLLLDEKESDGSTSTRTNNSAIPTLENTNTNTTANATMRTHAYTLAKGRFQDLTMSNHGSQVLESLFLDEIMISWNNHDIDINDDDDHHHHHDDVIHGTIYLIQSLCIMGMLVGVKGTPIQEQRRVQHLQSDFNNDNSNVNNYNNNMKKKKTDMGWNKPIRQNKPATIKDISIAQLKYESDQTPGTQLLAQLGWKRTTQGAMDLLIAMGVWTKHEDLSLLRSGFPVFFTDTQLQDADAVIVGGMESTTKDVDALLGIRQDFTHHKVYTIDSESASEVDDGLSVEELENGRLKYWIHIADADRWAPRHSPVFEIAKRRITTHYLPTGPVPMFPSSLGEGVMSLRPNIKSCALSLGVELHDDGSIDVDSIDVVQSTIQVNYRLTYDEVDDMLMEGVGYKEEWQLGAFQHAAMKRRELRIRNGSIEGMIPRPIPQSVVSVYQDDHQTDGIGIAITADVSHNQGLNQTLEVMSPTVGMSSGEMVNSVSDSNILVTEMMILAGEAIGKWKMRLDAEPSTFCGRYENTMTLPFRSQRAPEYWAREKEYKILQDLLRSLSQDHHHGYCHAWYARRFLSPVDLGPMAKPHFGLGVDCYVQWTSPIRRFGDLQVHAAVKRYLRRRRVHDLLMSQNEIPDGIQAMDVGCPIPSWSTSTPDVVTGDRDDDDDIEVSMDFLDLDINYNWGKAHMAASKVLSRQSQQYWLYEYIQRQMSSMNSTTPSSSSSNHLTFHGLVLGCVDPERLQYAVYLFEIGLEHRYVSQKGLLQVGEVLKLEVTSVVPRLNLMTLSLVNL